MTERLSANGPADDGGQFHAVDSTADDTATYDPAPVDQVADELPMNLLAAGIPLTLLLDLAENFGPPSSQIPEAEHDAVYHDPDAPAADWLSHLPTSGTPAVQVPLPEARTAPSDRDPADVTA